METRTPSPALRSIPLTGDGLDRTAHLRADPTLLARLLEPGSTTRVLEVADGRVPVEDAGVDGAGPSGPALRPVLRAPGPDDASWLAAYLGVDADGTPHVAVVRERAEEGWRGLREVGGLLGEADAGSVAAAVALANWHATHTHCPRCGTATVPDNAGWTRRCPADGSEHYPRTDPAVIMAVVDADDRILLGRGASWPEGRYSTLAGFVEPGESLEAAVRREVAEEASLEVTDVAYRGSQPWPFPASVMLGFRARALTTDARPDGQEVVEVRWFDREEYAAELRAGRVLRPTGFSIATRLIQEWYAAPLPGSESSR